MGHSPIPTIQDVIDKAKMYLERGISQEEAIKRAIAASRRLGTERKAKAQK